MRITRGAIEQQEPVMEWDYGKTWYHGSPFQLTTLRSGSTITQERNLARAFAHKPPIVCISDDGRIRHNGTAPGYLYRLDEEIGPEDVYPHPRSSVPEGLEWLTTRELAVTLIGPATIVDGERLADEEVDRLLRRQRQDPHGKDPSHSGTRS
jgi:hypothetical protein